MEDVIIAATATIAHQQTVYAPCIGIIITII